MALVAERGEHDRAWAHPERQRLRFARCCYGHLAGQMGVKIFDAMQQGERLKPGGDGYALTDAGRSWLAELGLIAAEPSGRRRYAYRCLDWSERRDHLAGQLADEIYAHCSRAGWLRRGAGRAVEVTVSGERDLLPHLRAEPPV